MKIIVIIISTDLVKIHFYPLFVLSYKPKTRIGFSGSWWSGKEKCFYFLFIASRALLQSHAEFNRLNKEIFLHVIPVRIIVPCSDLSVDGALII